MHGHDEDSRLYTDEQLTCTDCGSAFTFSAGEQEFFAAKGFQNKPNRCPDCRAARKASRSSGARGNGAREMYAVTCTSCGQPAEVPFQPRGDKPVYCTDCFSKARRA
jgi:CxxC-x17-CxxC domain-containing protein